MSHALRLQFIPDFLAWPSYGRTLLPTVVSNDSFRAELDCSAISGFDISPLPPSTRGVLPYIWQPLAPFAHLLGRGSSTDGTAGAAKAGSGAANTRIAAVGNGPLTEEGRFTN